MRDGDLCSHLSKGKKTGDSNNNDRRVVQLKFLSHLPTSFIGCVVVEGLVVAPLSTKSPLIVHHF